MSNFKLEECDFYPQGNRLLIEVIDPTKVKTIIEMPADKNLFPQFGRIVRMGPLVENPSNLADVARLEPGKYVTFQRVSATGTVTLPDKTQLLFLTQSEIQSVMVPRTPTQEESTGK